MIKVYGHPRSGNNLLMALCARNFYPDQDVSKPAGLIGHWRSRQTGANPYGQLAGGHMFWHGQELDGEPIYLYRDGRDVALSLWRSHFVLAPEHIDIGLSDYLRVTLDWFGTPGTPRLPEHPRRNVVQHWRDHLLAWQDAPALPVRYEDVVRSPAATLTAIAQRYNLPMPDQVQRVNERVGWYPNDGAPGRWQEYFSAGDTLFFNVQVTPDFWGLWSGR